MSKLSPQTLELLRLSLLRHADQASVCGIPISTFHMIARSDGFDVEEEEVGKELLYLLDKGLIVNIEKVISPEVVRYRLHASGRDLLASGGYK